MYEFEYRGRDFSVMWAESASFSGVTDKTTQNVILFNNGPFASPEHVIDAAFDYLNTF